MFNEEAFGVAMSRLISSGCHITTHHLNIVLHIIHEILEYHCNIEHTDTSESSQSRHNMINVCPIIYCVMTRLYILCATS